MPAGAPATVHYRRADGTEGRLPAWPDGAGGYTWTIPGDCAAVTGIDLPPAGGGGQGHTAATGTGCGPGGATAARPGLPQDLAELDQVGALAGIRAIITERLAEVRSGVAYGPADARKVIDHLNVSSAPGSPRRAQLLAQAASHLAAEIDRLETGG